MPAERVSMRKIRELLRLKFEHQFSNRKIALSCGIPVLSERLLLKFTSRFYY